jgi:hypothetical protein
MEAAALQKRATYLLKLTEQYYDETQRQHIEKSLRDHIDAMKAWAGVNPLLAHDDFNAWNTKIGELEKALSGMSVGTSTTYAPGLTHYYSSGGAEAAGAPVPVEALETIVDRVHQFLLEGKLDLAKRLIFRNKTVPGLAAAIRKLIEDPLVASRIADVEAAAAVGAGETGVQSFTYWFTTSIWLKM